MAEIEEAGSSEEDDKKNRKKAKSVVQVETSEQLLEKTGIKQYLNKMPSEFINNRICYGYLGKRSKGKIKYFQKRWFFLISAKPVVTLDTYTDEKILDESQM